MLSKHWSVQAIGKGALLELELAKARRENVRLQELYQALQKHPKVQPSKGAAGGCQPCMLCSQLM